VNPEALLARRHDIANQLSGGRLPQRHELYNHLAGLSTDRRVATAGGIKSA
jgi:hypothetical protein